MTSNTSEFTFTWPTEPLAEDVWQRSDVPQFRQRAMPENPEVLNRDSRWPAFFPAPVCLVTTTDGETLALEREVGASIVNRFPYVMAITFTRTGLSDRHHPRSRFCEILERSGVAAIQFLPPGPALGRALTAIATIPDARLGERLTVADLPVRPGRTNPSPVLTDAYMVYEARLAKPGKDFEGNDIHPQPWLDVGSHRVYFLEIETIQLREDIALGRTQLHWRSLPLWTPGLTVPERERMPSPAVSRPGKYVKGYTPFYRFPAANTVAFEYDQMVDGMAVKHLEPLPENQIEVDNDRARWPCFFPSSLGMITAWGDDGQPNVMPCGSTMVVSRHPFIIAPCISYSAINQRYAPRGSLPMIRARGSFGCGIAYAGDDIVEAIRYTGTVSIAEDGDKVANAGLRWHDGGAAPVLEDLPVSFECRLIGERLLGTHVMLLGEVTRILVRDDCAPDRRLEWLPHAELRPVPAE